MKTFLPQNQFISNSVSHVPVDTGSAAASPCPPSTAAAVAISEAAGKHPFPSVSADSEHEQQRKTLGVTDGRDHHYLADPDGGYMGPRLSPALGTSVGIAATDPCQEPVAASPIDHIHEIFFHARKLMKDDRRFVLDEGAFTAALDEPPIFLQNWKMLAR